MMARSNPAWLWLLVLAFGWPSYADELPVRSAVTEKKRQEILYDWRVWEGLNVLKAGEVQSVRIVLQRRKLMSTQFGPVTLDVTERSPETIALFVAALADVRVVGIGRTDDMAWTRNQAGQLTFRTAKGDVLITVYTNEFLFESPPDSGRYPGSYFDSVSLATLLDAFLRKEGIAWPADRLRRLSGGPYVDANLTDGKKWTIDPVGVRLAADDLAGHRRRHPPQPLGDEWIYWDLCRSIEEPFQLEAARLTMPGAHDKVLDVVVEGKENLLLLRKAMRGIVVCPRHPPDLPDDADDPLGELRLSTTNGDMLVEICRDGFRLRPVPKEFGGKGGALPFQSPSLAYLIDALRRSAGAPPLSDELREALSGEAYLKAKRAAMRDLIEKVPAFRHAVREPRPISPVLE
jgi:hypothetical protein